MEKRRNDFQVRYMRWSYRMRGMVPRVHRKRKAKAIVAEARRRSVRGGKEVWRKKVEEKRLMAKILTYSAMKIRANEPLPYSVLNPETSSDSPSAKSNGVRLVSASIVMNQHNMRGGHRKAAGVRFWVERRFRESEEAMKRGVRRIRVILTSYEIVCATLRRAPRRAYLEFEDHPAPKVV